MSTIIAACGDDAGTTTTQEPGATTSAPGNTIRVGAVEDLTGGVSLYGIPQFQATQLAIQLKNSSGGLLGKQLELVSYDSQSSDDRAVEFVDRLLGSDEVEVIVATTTSGSREAVRPVVDRYGDTLFFYGVEYEGGVCDKLVFVTGATASQQNKAAIEYAANNLGNSIYIIAPDYNYGQISTLWVKEYASEFGLEVVGEELLPLDIGTFESTIAKLQSTQPDIVFALPVGGAQTAMIPQMHAAGLTPDEMTILTLNYGTGNQQLAVSAEAGEGIVRATAYVPEIDTPANAVFREQWVNAWGYTSIPVTAHDHFTSWQFWFKAVEEAGTTDTATVTEVLENGLEIEAPNGPMRMEGPSHHATMDIFIVRQNASQGWEVLESLPQVQPTFEIENCDLVSDPEISEQFTP